MKISRTVLLSALKIVSPALSSNKNQVEELSYFWFDGTHLSAYDDVIGIKIEFETEFKGGVSGDKLVGILDKSRAKEVTITEEEDKNLLLKVGAARIKLVLKPIEDWFWDPVLPENKHHRISTEFMNAVDMVLLSVGNGKVLSPEQRGITVIQNGGIADLFSTDAVSISWMPVKADFDFERIILPTSFCEQLKKIMDANSSELVFDENSVYCVGEIFVTDDVKTNALLFSKLVEDDNPVPFVDTVNGYVNDTIKGFSIPSRLSLSLDRALVILSEGQPAEIEIRDSHLYLFAQAASAGEVDDAIKLEGAEEHNEIIVNADLNLLKRGLEGRKFLAVTKDCLVLKGPLNFIHVIANK